MPLVSIYFKCVIIFRLMLCNDNIWAERQNLPQKEAVDAHVYALAKSAKKNRFYVLRYFSKTVKSWSNETNQSTLQICNCASGDPSWSPGSWSFPDPAALSPPHHFLCVCTVLSVKKGQKGNKSYFLFISFLFNLIDLFRPKTYRNYIKTGPFGPLIEYPWDRRMLFS